MRTQRSAYLPSWIGLLAALSLLPALACNLGGVSTSSITPPPVVAVDPESGQFPGVSTLEVVNGLPEDMCVLYLSYTSVPSWGSNRLDVAGSIPVGGAFTIDLPANHYDLRAEGCSGEWKGELRDLDVTVNTSAYVTADVLPVEEAPGGQTSPVIVWLYEDCTLPVLTSDTPMVVRVPWIATTAALAESNADRMSFTISVDDRPITVEPVRSAVQNEVTLAELGCPEGDEQHTMVYWDLAIGSLQPGSHLVKVDYYTDQTINDGLDTYEAGWIGDLWLYIEVTAATPSR